LQTIIVLHVADDDQSVTAKKVTAGDRSRLLARRFHDRYPLSLDRLVCHCLMRPRQGLVAIIYLRGDNTVNDEK
jgi:hypothetical protein